MPIPQPSPSRPEFLLEIRRTFHAPGERVFLAWARREELERWMCKDVPSHQIIHHEQDIRTGGRWVIEIRDSKKNEVYWGRGNYLEVKPPEKIVFTWSWSKNSAGSQGTEHVGQNPVTEVTVEFFDCGGDTELVLTHRGLASGGLREEHQAGWTGCLDELEKTLV
jgi:uncharacterized protein YndB with AHSA1/START domain